MASASNDFLGSWEGQTFAASSAPFGGYHRYSYSPRAEQRSLNTNDSFSHPLSDTQHSVVCDPSNLSVVCQDSSGAFVESSSLEPRNIGIDINLKLAPRLEPMDMNFKHDSFSESFWDTSPTSASTDTTSTDATDSFSSWDMSPTSASTDTTSFHGVSPVYPIGSPNPYDSGSSPHSMGAEYSFISGLPCHTSGPDNDGRHLSEPFQHLFQIDDFTPANTVSPEILVEPKYEENLRQTSYATPADLQYAKPKVASDRVLAASRRRRTDRKAGAKLLSCRMCNATFTARHNWNNHMNSHFGRRPYPCLACRQAFGTRHVLQRHQKTCQAYLGSTHLTTAPTTSTLGWNV